MKPIENISQLLEKIEGAYADNTIRAYRSNLNNFQVYCQQTHQAFLPATTDTLVGFIDHLLQQNLSAHYIRRHMAAIAHLHRMSR
jgi:integrase/recombinase XerD